MLFLYCNIVVFLSIFLCMTSSDDGIEYTNKCEVCKIFAEELENRLQETGKTSEFLEIGYSVRLPKNKKEYIKSEMHLFESLDRLCEKLLEYNIHKERTNSTRFAKGMSQTFQTLRGLVDKGIKVKISMPYALWDKPSIEVTNMKAQCEDLLETYGADIEQWYFSHQTIRLTDYLCKDRALKNSDISCLDKPLSKGDARNIKQEL